MLIFGKCYDDQGGQKVTMQYHCRSPTSYSTRMTTKRATAAASDSICYLRPFCILYKIICIYDLAYVIMINIDMYGVCCCTWSRWSSC